MSGPERISSTGKPFHDAIPFARALIEAAPDRVLWGTDFPHPNVKAMPNDGGTCSRQSALMRHCAGKS